jgi:hypothetical protein
VYTLWSNQLFSLSPGPDTTVKGPHSTDKLMFLQGYTNYFFFSDTSMSCELDSMYFLYTYN